MPVADWAEQLLRIPRVRALPLTPTAPLAAEALEMHPAGHPSLISLRLARVENVNAVLERVLPRIARAVLAGSIVTVEEDRLGIRVLPLGS